MKIERPKRDQVIAITVTEEEKDRIFLMAHEAGLTVSGYIRLLVSKEAERKSARD